MLAEFGAAALWVPAFTGMTRKKAHHVPALAMIVEKSLAASAADMPGVLQ